MAKIAIKSEKLSPFGGIFSIMEQFAPMLSYTIDMMLGPTDTAYCLKAHCGVGYCAYVSLYEGGCGFYHE